MGKLILCVILPNYIKYISHFIYFVLLKHAFYVAAIESENGTDQEQENETQIDAASPSSSVSIYFNIFI